MKYSLNTEQREDGVLSPADIQPMALPQKALSGYRTFFLSLYLYVCLFLLVETPASFNLALWGTQKSFVMECRLLVIPKVSSSPSRSPFKSKSIDWVSVCVLKHKSPVRIHQHPSLLYWKPLSYQQKKSISFQHSPQTCSSTVVWKKSPNW